MAAKPEDLGDQDKDLTPTLVAGLREGDPEAGKLLNTLYRERLIRFCWGYVGAIDEAEDAVQEICYKVLTAPKVPDAFRPWLYQTARNECLNLLRRRIRHQERRALPVVSELHEILTGHLTRLVRDEQRSRLGELVCGLPEAQQEVLRLRYVEDLSRAEIAETLELPESVVKSRLFEGLKRLREKASLLDGP